MKNHRINALFVLTSLFCCAVAITTRGDAAGAFVIVTNASNQQQNMSQSELRKVFSGGIKQWSNGAVVVVGIIPSDAPETTYLSKLLDTTPTDLLRRIQEQVFRGEMRRPAVLHSSNECFAFARSNPGALCAAAMPGAAPAGVQIVSMH
jgi:hypothetical protein